MVPTKLYTDACARMNTSTFLVTAYPNSKPRETLIYQARRSSLT